MEDAKPGKLVQRQVTRILTPGTVITDNLLESKHNQYTVCIKWHKESISMAWVEVSTGDFQIAEGKDLNEIAHIISALSPQEIILDDENLDLIPVVYLEDRIKNYNDDETPEFEELNILCQNLFKDEVLPEIRPDLYEQN